jgi:hypothetical protein
VEIVVGVGLLPIAALVYGRGLHSFTFPLNVSFFCPFPLNLSLLCSPCNRSYRGCIPRVLKLSSTVSDVFRRSSS